MKPTEFCIKRIILGCLFSAVETFTENGGNRYCVQTLKEELELTTVEMPKKFWVKSSQIRTLAVERIGERIGRASPEEIAQVIEGLIEIIGA